MTAPSFPPILGSVLHPNAAHPLFSQAPSLVETWVLHQQVLSSLGQALRAFQEVKLPCLVVKGAALAHELYERPGERPMVDADLRVRPADLTSVLTVARKKGWGPVWDSPQWGTIMLPIDGVAIEVETSMGPPGLSGLTIGDLLARSEVRCVGQGITCNVPETSDHALLLTVNIFKDKLVHCREWSLEDLLRIVHNPRFDQERFLRGAKEGHIVTLAWVVARWLVDEGLSEPWPTLEARLRQLGIQRRYGEETLKAFQTDPDGMRSRLLCRLGSDSPRLRSKALALSVAGMVRKRLHRGPPQPPPAPDRPRTQPKNRRGVAHPFTGPTPMATPTESHR